MAMHMKLQMQLKQHLIMTPQLQQAIKLLQLSRVELEELIEQTLIENPVLEEGMDIDTFPSKDPEKEEVSKENTLTETMESVQEIEKETPTTEEVDWQQYVEQIDQFRSGSETRGSNSSSDSDEAPSLEATLAESESLADHLTWQLNMSTLAPLEHKIGVYLVGNINSDGYLTTSILDLMESNPHLHEEILNFIIKEHPELNTDIDPKLFETQYSDAPHTLSQKSSAPQPPVFDDDDEEEENDEAAPFEMMYEVGCFVEAVLQKIQTFDPNGVGGRSLQECLLIQLNLLQEDHDLSYKIIQDDMHLLETKDLKKIARRHKQKLETVIDAYKVIMALEPKPGRIYSGTGSNHYIIPDVYIYVKDNEYKVALNSAGIPRLRLSQYYRELSETAADDGTLTREYIQEKLKSGQWLMKSIEQRQKTIYRVTKSILKFQKAFFERGIHYLKPLVLKDVAEDIEVHESTVSRITTNKYVHTPQGIFELKYFFTSGIDQASGEAVSSKRIKEMILQMVNSENPRSPYTDLQIADILYTRSSIKVARRTVAKYREAMNILPSNKRKQLF